MLAAAEEAVANPGNPPDLFVLYIFIHCKCMFDGPGVQQKRILYLQLLPKHFLGSEVCAG